MTPDLASTGPADTSSVIDQARRLYAAGDLGACAAVLRRWVMEHPDDPQGYHYLGVCYLALGKAFPAVGLLERAVRLAPHDAAPCASLGVALRAAGDMPGASKAMADALAIDPASPYVNLEAGLLLLCSIQANEALACFRRVLQRDPGNHQAQIGVALAHVLAGRIEEGRDSLVAAAGTQPAIHHIPGYLATNLQRQGRREDALMVMRLAMAMGVDDAELAFRVAAAAGSSELERVPDGYLRAHFDQLAASFDSHLVDRLQYGVPQLILQAVEPHLPGMDLSVLDGGCGTGLCGPLLRPVAGRLKGVDISAKMLAEARARGIYDELVEGELLAELSAELRRHDLIVCADVLIYFGDLHAFFSAAVGALRRGGLLAVSIERQTDLDYVLQTSGRFAHAPEYLRRVARAVDLVELEAIPCELRLEMDEPVAGEIYVYRRPGTRTRPDRKGPGNLVPGSDQV